MIESWIKKNALWKKCCNKISTLWIYPNFCVTVIESNSILCGAKKIRDGYNCSLGTKKIVNLKFVSLFFNQIFFVPKSVGTLNSNPSSIQKSRNAKERTRVFLLDESWDETNHFFLTANEFLIQVLYQIIENWNILISKNNRNKNTFETLFAGNSSSKPFFAAKT